MYEVECPYCLEDVEVDTDNYGVYEQDVLHDMECPKCEKTFVFETTITFSFSSDKADCLNEGGEHNYEKTHTIPEEFSKMRCTMCSCEREMTQEERIKFNIETKESYLENLKLLRKEK